MQDVFELQDEIARKIAEALRITLSPQEEEALAAKPTENLQAYDLYLRGKSYARRLTRQDLEFALQMFENAVSVDPGFALAHAAIANACAQYHYHYEREKKWLDRAVAASQRASALGRHCRKSSSRRAGSCTRRGSRPGQPLRAAGDRAEGRLRRAYYLLGRALFAAGRYQEVVDIAEEGDRRLRRGLQRLRPDHERARRARQGGSADSLRPAANQFFEAHLRKIPEDARARVLLANDYAEVGRAEDAKREVALAMALRPNEATVLYNAACLFVHLIRKTDAMDALRRAWEAGFKDPSWARRDPDLEVLHGDPEFERLYPPEAR